MKTETTGKSPAFKIPNRLILLFAWVSINSGVSLIEGLQPAMKSYQNNRLNGSDEDGPIKTYPDGGLSKLNIKSAGWQSGDKWPDSQGRYWWDLTLENGHHNKDFCWIEDKQRGWPEKGNKDRYWFKVLGPHGLEIAGFSIEPEPGRYPDIKDNKYYSFVQYTECGPIKDWMEKRDRNYRARIERERVAKRYQQLREAQIARQQKKLSTVSSTSQTKQAKALYDFTAIESDDLPFKAGQVLTVLVQDGDWWQCELDGKKGLVPSNYVELIPLPKGTVPKLPMASQPSRSPIAAQPNNGPTIFGYPNTLSSHTPLHHLSPTSNQSSPQAPPVTMQTALQDNDLLAYAKEVHVNISHHSKPRNQTEQSNQQALAYWQAKLQESELKMEMIQQDLQAQMQSLEADINNKNEQLKKKIYVLEQTKTQQQGQANSSQLQVLELEVAQLKQDITPLTKKYQAKTVLLRQQQYLLHHKCEGIRAFYDMVLAKLNGTFTSLMVLNYGGLVKAAKNSTVNTAANAAQQAVSVGAVAVSALGHISRDAVPFISSGINLLVGAAQYGLSEYEQSQRKAAGEVLPVTPQQMERLAEKTARLLTYRYEDQIMRLKADSARILARNAVNKIIAGLYEKKLTVERHHSLPEQLMLLVSIMVANRQGEVDCVLFKVPTASQQKFKAIDSGGTLKDEDIFRRKTGIKFLNDAGKIDYYRPVDYQNDKYGFRWGDADEKASLRFIGKKTRFVACQGPVFKQPPVVVMQMANQISKAQLKATDVQLMPGMTPSAAKQLNQQGADLGNMRDKFELSEEQQRRERQRLEKAESRVDELQTELKAEKERNARRDAELEALKEQMQQFMQQNQQSPSSSKTSGFSY